LSLNTSVLLEGIPEKNQPKAITRLMPDVFTNHDLSYLALVQPGMQVIIMSCPEAPAFDLPD